MTIYSGKGDDRDLLLGNLGIIGMGLNDYGIKMGYM